MTITFYQTKDPNNKLIKNLTQVGDALTGVLRDGCSILAPRILIEYAGTFPANVNYMYIAEFGRYYFVGDPVAVRNNVWEIPANIDPLMSHATDIKKCKGIVHRSADVKAYNVMLDDGTFRTYANPEIRTVSFPNGFSNAEFLLAVAGGASTQSE